jgi:hypothetical protein
MEKYGIGDVGCSNVGKIVHIERHTLPCICTCRFTMINKRSVAVVDLTERMMWEGFSTGHVISDEHRCSPEMVPEDVSD